MKELLLKMLLAVPGLDEAKRKEIEAEINKLEAEKKPAPTQPEPKPGEQTVALPQQVVEALAEVKNLKALIEKQEQRAADADKQSKERSQADGKKKLDEYIKKVVETEKKISPAEMKEKWQPLLEANFDITSKIIDSLPVHPAAKRGDSNPKEGEQKKTGQPGNDYVVNRKGYLEDAAAEFVQNMN